MLSNGQKSLIAQACRACGLSREEYEAALAAATQLPGITSSTDARLTDRHFDLILGYLEAIYERGRAKAPAEPSVPHSEIVNRNSKIFSRPGYWQSRNPKGNTTRDRHVASTLQTDIAEAEAALRATGYHPNQIGGILKRTRGGRAYLYALQRTLKYRKAKAATTPPVHPALRVPATPRRGRSYQLRQFDPTATAGQYAGPLGSTYAGD